MTPHDPHDPHGPHGPTGDSENVTHTHTHTHTPHTESVVLVAADDVQRRLVFKAPKGTGLQIRESN